MSEIQTDLFGEVEAKLVVAERAATVRPPKPPSERAQPKRRKPRIPTRQRGLGITYDCRVCGTEQVPDEGAVCRTCEDVLAERQAAAEREFFRWQATTHLEQGEAVFEHACNQNRDWTWDPDDDQLIAAHVAAFTDPLCQRGGCHRLEGKRRFWHEYEAASRRRWDWGRAWPMPRWIPFDHWIEDWTCADIFELWDENGIEPWFVPVATRPWEDVELGPAGVAALGAVADA